MDGAAWHGVIAPSHSVAFAGGPPLSRSLRPTCVVSIRVFGFVGKFETDASERICVCRRRHQRRVALCATSYGAAHRAGAVDEELDTKEASNCPRRPRLVSASGSADPTVPVCIGEHPFASGAHVPSSSQTSGVMFWSSSLSLTSGPRCLPAKWPRQFYTPTLSYMYISTLAERCRSL